jgi:penicillin V acylase-like amidase (Ntn superfamily)
MNEKGLVANMLWLGESQYPKFDPKGSKKGLPSHYGHNIILIILPP